LEVTEANTNSYSKILENVLSNVMYSPIHHPASTLMVNIQSTLQTAPYLCKNVSVAVLFGSNGISYSLYRVKCVYIYTVKTLVGHKKQKNKNKNEKAVNVVCQGNPST